MRTATLLVFGMLMVSFMCWGSPIDQKKSAGHLKRAVELHQDAPAPAGDEAAASTEAEAAAEAGAEAAPEGEASTEGASGPPAGDVPPPGPGKTTAKPNSASPLAQSTVILILTLSTSMIPFC